LIQINHLEKTYAQQEVIRDVSFEIHRGEIFGIVGRSGVGKSTLLRCINALEPITAGDINIDGTSLVSLNEEGIRQLRKKISMIFQNFNLLSQKTALENVTLPMEIWGVDQETRQRRAKELLDLVGLTQKYDSKPKALSGGEKQRVAIARALALDPEILLCDEATSALDPNTTKEILSLLKKINTQLGLTIVVVTHQMEVIKEICQRVAVMEKGKVSALGNVEDLFLNPGKSLKKLIGEDEMEVLPKGTNIRIFFTKEFSNQSIITAMARDLNVDFSIVWGKLENFSGDVLGSLVISIDDGDRDRILDYLTAKGLNTEVIVNEL
jgi:D-methionine transport system ATP-binding protein